MFVLLSVKINSCTKGSVSQVQSVNPQSTWFIFIHTYIFPFDIISLFSPRSFFSRFSLIFFFVVPRFNRFAFLIFFFLMFYSCADYIHFFFWKNNYQDYNNCAFLLHFFFSCNCIFYISNLLWMIFQTVKH